MRIPAFFIYSLLLTLLLGSCKEGLPEYPLLISALASHGGRDAIVNASVVHARGRIRAVFLGDEGTYEYWFDRKGSSLRVETRYARHSETRVLEGAKGLGGQGGGPLVEVSGFRYDAMLYQYRHIDMLFGLINGEYSVEDKGEARTPSGRSARAFGLRPEQGPPMTIYLDPIGGMLMSVAGYFDVNGKSAELSTEFYEYRDAGGIMMPFRLVNFAGSTRIAETVIDSYVLDLP